MTFELNKFFGCVRGPHSPACEERERERERKISFLFVSILRVSALSFFFSTPSETPNKKKRNSANGIMLVDADDLPSPDDIIDGRDESFPKPVKEEKKRRKPFWFEGTYRTDEAGNEVERIRDGRWEEDFDEGDAKNAKKKGREEEEEEESDGEKPAWLIPEEESGGGREGWE